MYKYMYTHYATNRNRAVYISSLEQALMLEEALQREERRLAERVCPVCCCVHVYIQSRGVLYWGGRELNGAVLSHSQRLNTCAYKNRNQSTHPDHSRRSGA